MTASTQPESPGNSGEWREQFLALKDRLFSAEALDAAGRVKIETTYPHRTVDLDKRREIIAAAWNVATGHDHSLLLTQPVPGNSRGVEEGADLSDAVGALQAQILRLAAETPCPDFDEAREHCDCLLCRTQMIIAHWEDDPRFGSGASQEVIAWERGLRAASTQPQQQPSSPQAEVQDCETCDGEGDFIGGSASTGGHIARLETCPDCNGTGKQSPAEPDLRDEIDDWLPAEPQGDVVEPLARGLYEMVRDALPEPVKPWSEVHEHFEDRARELLTPLLPGSSYVRSVELYVRMLLGEISPQEYAATLKQEVRRRRSLPSKSKSTESGGGR